MGRKYDFMFIRPTGESINGWIDVDGYEGTSRALKCGDFSLQYQGDTTSQVITSTASLSIVKEPGMGFYELFMKHPREVRISIRRDGEIIWRGYYDAESYEDSLAEGTAELAFSCGLNRLGDEVWTSENQWVSHRETIRRILGYWGTEFDSWVDICSLLVPSDDTSYSPHAIMREMAHDSVYSGKSHKSIIESICALYGLRACRQGRYITFYPHYSPSEVLTLSRYALATGFAVAVPWNRSQAVGVAGQETAGELRRRGQIKRKCVHGMKRLAIGKGDGQLLPIFRNEYSPISEAWVGAWDLSRISTGEYGKWIALDIRNPLNNDVLHRKAEMRVLDGKDTVCWPGQPRVFPGNVSIFPMCVHRTYTQAPLLEKIDFSFTFRMKAKPLSEIPNSPNPNLPKVLSMAFLVRIRDLDTDTVTYFNPTSKKFAYAGADGGPYDSYGFAGDRFPYEIFDSKEAGGLSKTYSYSLEMTELQGIYRDPFDTATFSRREVMFMFCPPNCWYVDDPDASGGRRTMTQEHYEFYDYYLYDFQCKFHTKEPAGREVTYESDGIGREEKSVQMLCCDGLHEGYAGEVLTALDVQAATSAVATAGMTSQKVKKYMYDMNGQPVFTSPESRVRVVSMDMFTILSDVRETIELEFRAIPYLRMGDVLRVRGSEIGDSEYWVQGLVTDMSMTTDGMKVTLMRIRLDSHTLEPMD